MNPYLEASENRQINRLAIPDYTCHDLSFEMLLPGLLWIFGDLHKWISKRRNHIIYKITGEVAAARMGATSLLPAPQASHSNRKLNMEDDHWSFTIFLRD